MIYIIVHIDISIVNIGNYHKPKSFWELFLHTEKVGDEFDEFALLVCLLGAGLGGGVTPWVCQTFIDGLAVKRNIP